MACLTRGLTRLTSEGSLVRSQLRPLVLPVNPLIKVRPARRLRRRQAGVPIEEIAALAGHSTTRTTELVYRKELRPVLRTGATVMGELLAAGQ
jgi:integrase